MARPNVTSNYQATPTGAPTSASQRVLAIIGEGSLTFTVTEKVTRFSPPPPTAPTVTPEGTAGSTNWAYKVTSVTAGGESSESVAATTSTGNADLDNTNYNHIAWTAVSGATSYNVYRIAPGGDIGTQGPQGPQSPYTTATFGLIGNTTGLYLDDKALIAGADFPGSSDVLAHVPVSIQRVGNYQTTTDYALTTNYVMSGTGITWVGTPAPAGGAKYWVTYTYAKVIADYAPQLFTGGNLGPIAAQYGPITAALVPGSLDPASQLTMAAQIAMAPGIGASQLILVQLQPTVPGTPTLADFQAALLLLQAPVANVKPYYIVPLVGNLADGDVNSVNAACLAHCTQMSDPQFSAERRAYSGLKSNATYNSLIAALQALGSLNNSRITIAANMDPQLSIVSGGAAQTITLDGSFVAVALAALRSTQQVSMPELNVLITAFNGFVTNFDPVQIDLIDDNGGMVLENVSGVISTVNDVTVNISSDIEKSIPTVETRDDLILGCRLELKRQVLGQRGSLTVPSEIEDVVDEYLKTRIASGDIMRFSPSSAYLVPNTITKYAVSFSYKPAGEVLQITVNFTIDLNLA